MSNNNPQLSVATPAVPASKANGAPRQELDYEDRRWELEWTRRNIED
jgi:hypothetical protein